MCRGSCVDKPASRAADCTTGAARNCYRGPLRSAAGAWSCSQTPSLCRAEVLVFHEGAAFTQLNTTS